MVRRGRRCKVDDLKEKREYWQLKDDALIALCAELALEEATE